MLSPNFTNSNIKHHPKLTQRKTKCKTTILNFRDLVQSSPVNSHFYNFYKSLKLFTLSLLTSFLFIACTCESPTDPSESPVITNHNFSVGEGITDLFVFGTVKATDPEDDALTYALQVNSNNLFRIDSTNGDLRLVSGQSLDYEMQTNHSLTVRVSNGNSHSSATVTIMVEDTNEPPVIMMGTFTVDRSKALSLLTGGTPIIGSVVATDPEGEPITYYGLRSNSEGLFRIDSASGDLRLAVGKGFIDLMTNHYLLITEAFEGSFTNLGTVTIALNNDIVVGGSGDDMLQVGASDDIVNGGAGSDTVTYPSPGNFTLKVTNFGGDTNGYLLESTANGSDILLNVEAIQFSDMADSFSGYLSDFSNLHLNAGGGIDNLTLSDNGVILRADAHSGFENITGGSGADTITGTDADETLSGGAGEDTLTGGGGADIFVARTSDDTLTDFSDGEDKVNFANIGRPIDLSELTINSDGTDAAIVYSVGGVDHTLTILGVNSGGLLTIADFQAVGQTFRVTHLSNGQSYSGREDAVDTIDFSGLTASIFNTHASTFTLSNGIFIVLTTPQIETMFTLSSIENIVGHSQSATLSLTGNNEDNRIDRDSILGGAQSYTGEGGNDVFVIRFYSGSQYSLIDFKYGEDMLDVSSYSNFTVSGFSSIVYRSGDRYILQYNDGILVNFNLPHESEKILDFFPVGTFANIQNPQITEVTNFFTENFDRIFITNN